MVVQATQQSVLFTMCQLGVVGSVRALLEEFPGLHAGATAKQDYPLHAAARNGHAAVVRELLVSDTVDVNAVNVRVPTLHCYWGGVPNHGNRFPKGLRRLPPSQHWSSHPLLNVWVGWWGGGWKDGERITV